MGGWFGVYGTSYLYVLVLVQYSMGEDYPGLVPGGSYVYVPHRPSGSPAAVFFNFRNWLLQQLGLARPPIARLDDANDGSCNNPLSSRYLPSYLSLGASCARNERPGGARRPQPSHPILEACLSPFVRKSICPPSVDAIGRTAPSDRYSLEDHPFYVTKSSIHSALPSQVNSRVLTFPKSIRLSGPIDPSSHPRWSAETTAAEQMPPGRLWKATSSLRWQLDSNLPQARHPD